MVQLPSPGETPWDVELNAAINGIDADLQATKTEIDYRLDTFDVESAAANALLGNTFGIDEGEIASPWTLGAKMAQEWWTLANFQTGGGYNSTNLAPSLTGNGTSQMLRTRPYCGNQPSGDTIWRLEFDYTMPDNGWAGISLAATDASLVVYPGTQEQWLVGSGSKRRSGHFLFYFKPTGTGGLYLQLKLELGNNCASGLLSVSNVSLRVAGHYSRTMLVSQQYQNALNPEVHTQHYDIPNRVWRIGRQLFDADNALTPVAFSAVDGYSTDQPYQNTLPDPDLARTSGFIYSNTDEAYITIPGTSLRVNNNDQIMVIWNGTAWEYRGNTHGGEYTRPTPGVSYKIDYGSGAGLVPWTLSPGLLGCERFQITLPSEYRLTNAGTTPYANVDRIITCFPDGMTRVDRTTTFLSTQVMQNYFEWMSSHDTTTPYVGRIGRGLTVLQEVDTHPLLTEPVVGTLTTATTGGTLPAATYSYRVTARTPYGETTAAAAKTIATTGTTSTATVPWGAVSGATSYGVYGRTGSGTERLLATVGGSAVSYVDTGSAIPSIQEPPRVNTARLYNGTTALMSAVSTSARWSVWREPRSGWCYGNIYDSETVLARPEVDKVLTRLEKGSGIHKQYTNLMWAANADSVTIPANTVWTATHFSFVYRPENPDRYHTEIAVRAAALASLKDIYPAT